MDWKRCFFIGHRTAPDSIRPKLLESIERHITDYGVTEFVVGHYGHFDFMAAAAVRAAKKPHPNISLVLLLPYYPLANTQNLNGYDDYFFPPGMEHVPKPFAIARANEYMIRNSDFLICYNAGTIGNTRRLVELAAAKERNGLIRITNIAET